MNTSRQLASPEETVDQPAETEPALYYYKMMIARISLDELFILDHLGLMTGQAKFKRPIHSIGSGRIQ